MKQLLLTLTLLFNVISSMASVTVGDFVYELNTTDNTCSLVGTNIKSGDIEIPSEIIYGGKNYTVTSIGDWAFCDQGYNYPYKGLKSVKIPNTVTSIGNAVFYGSGLESVELPDGLISIGTSDFRYCTSLKSIELPNSVTSIGGSAFEGCTSLKSIEFPNSVTSIGEDAFNGCTSLRSIELPNSVTSIGEGTFSGCI